MTPSQVAQSLRHIASKIDNSKLPDRTLVARDLRGLLTQIAQEQEECGMGGVAQQQQGQQEQQALPKSGVGQQMLMEAISELQDAAKSGDHSKFEKALAKVNGAKAKAG